MRKQLKEFIESICQQLTELLPNNYSQPACLEIKQANDYNQVVQIQTKVISKYLQNQQQNSYQLQLH